MTQTWSVPPRLPPANWYPDPSGVADLRYWNGWGWTVDVVVSGEVVTRPMPPPPPFEARVAAETQLRLPIHAAVIALVGFVAGVGGSVGLSLAGQAVGLPRLGRVLLSQAALWAGLLGAVREVSRRYGTGHPMADFRVRVGWGALGWGALMSLAARMAAGVAVAIVIVVFRRAVGTNDRVFRSFSDDTVAFVIISLLAVVGAPIVEELFFRGVVQGAFLDAMGTFWAITVQAVVFGLAHFNPLYGVTNVTIVAAVASAGVIFGITVRLRGLGASMFAHAFFNVVAVVATFALT